MNKIPGLLTVLCLHVALLAVSARADEGGVDRGKEVVGKIRATLFIGTDADPATLGDKLPAVADATANRLRSVDKMSFKHYRKLGTDTQPVYRSYENWLTPLKPSEEILLSFESRGRSSDGGLRLDLEFWQHRRKVMKSDPVLQKGRPLLILGPKWRGGTLIIAVELIQISLKE
ncbi:MAG: hypothetical protein H7A51_12005 [Akkermansiaceae bacterium]|nr:hypothetical protein [Akkermansiaceae bacterium]